jgi:hypothetical protein
MIEEARRKINSKAQAPLNTLGDIVMMELIGEGTFGRVYRGEWRGGRGKGGEGGRKGQA